jgi:hypothetical protein
MKKSKQMDMLDYDSMLKAMQRAFRMYTSNKISLWKKANICFKKPAHSYSNVEVGSWVT